MCSTCGCRKAESFQAPYTPGDEYCVACGKDGVGIKTNLCKGCQESMGIKKISARRLAELGWNAESLEAETSIAQEYSETIDDIEDLEEQVKKTVAPKRKPTKYLREAKGSVMDSWKQMRKDGFRKEMYDQYIKDAEGVPKGFHRMPDGTIMADSAHMAESFEANNWPNREWFDKSENKIYVEIVNNIGSGAVMGIAEDLGKRHIKTYSDAVKWLKKHNSKFPMDNPMNLYESKYAKILWKHSQESNAAYGAESFEAEESSKGLPWMTFAFIGLGAFVASRIKTVGFKADGDCGCGCSGKSDCGDEKKADEGHYPNTYDPVQDFLPRYRYPEDSDWSNSYNPADPYRPLDYQTVQTDSRTTADRM
jgi:hypothetical protein|tara:strand:+ start:2237 stop:3331 length:1095 start_codon:yes stop_codon:yes gene_type:complete